MPGDVHAERYPGADGHGLTLFYNQVIPMAVKKLSKAWGTDLETTAIATTSREYAAERITDGDRWQLPHLESGQVIGETFDSRETTEMFQRPLETPAQEAVQCVFIRLEMRADLLKHGLPRLEAVSKSI